MCIFEGLITNKEAPAKFLFEEGGGRGVEGMMGGS